MPNLERGERRKRRREQITIVLVMLAIVVLANFALKLVKLSSTLPFVNSIFFFGIINLNLILLAVLVFLIFRNLSKIFLERRRGLLGSKLKSKLVASFLSLSIVPTVVLFFVSTLYINSTFDKWFSVKVGNTLQASLEITDIYYKNTQRSAQHFAERIREEVAFRMDLDERYARTRISRELSLLRAKYALDAVEVYWHPLDPRTLVVRPELALELFPRLPIESVQKALDGDEVMLVQHVGTGDVLRSVVPLQDGSTKKIVGALAVSYHLPTSLVNKVDEISSTYADFRDVNPLKYPVKTIYLAILILITLLVTFAAIWVGLYLARQMTMPLENLALAASQVGAGNLDVEISTVGDDEIATVSSAFNKMTTDLRENRDRLQTTYSTLQSTNEELGEQRRYLEAILANVSAGVCSIAADSTITTMNKSAANLLGVQAPAVIGQHLNEVLTGPLSELHFAISQVREGGGKETIFKYINVTPTEGRPLSLLVTIYLAILILITLLVTFAAIWVGLYLARQMTMPLENLALAASQVGAGNLDVEISTVGDDEIATVSSAFNKMTTDLRENRDRLQTTYSTLQSTNEELGEQRRYLEAILANVSAGVCSIAADSTITTMNKSAANLLGVQAPAVIGQHLNEVLTGPLSELHFAISQVREGGGKETIFKYINVTPTEGRPLSLLVTITPLHDSDSRYLGLVLVLDDISHLIKAQREVAWREVARRIAHEIKNPLTPIKLSAQRLQKRYMDKLDESDVFKECTDTIIREVDGIRDMVNEFSQFARLPMANPLPNEINATIAEVVGLYSQGHRNIHFDFQPDGNVPVFSFDRDQIKRVVVNLVDNAVAAMKEQEEGTLQVTTQIRREAGLVVVQVADTGAGIPEDVLPMLFEPYFSTKKEGTGLGLAIAKRIVNDHDGYIRASSGKKDGKFVTTFTVELPVNRTSEVMQHGS